MNSRRQILKLLGLAPAAATSAVSQLAGMVASPSVLAASTVGMTALAGQAGQPAQSFGALGPVIGKQLQKLLRQSEDEVWAIRNSRPNGIDPDIQALRSVSQVNKVRKQRERDCELSSVIRGANELMWG